MENVIFGTITKTQGLKGEFRVKAQPKYLPYINKLKVVNILGNNYHVKKIVDRGGFFVFSLQEFNHINQIESFINNPISAVIENVEEMLDYAGYKLICDKIGRAHV